MKRENPSGVERTDVVDVVSHDEKSDLVTLTIVEERPWGRASNQLAQLEEKLNNYLVFALDGQLERKYPEYARKAIRIRLYCRFSPDGPALDFLDRVEAALAAQKITFEIESWE